MADTDVVVNDAENNRYVLMRGDQELGETFYEYGERDELNFVHTEIKDGLEEHGLGTQLVIGALDDVRANTQSRVVASCPFVFKFLATHPEYQDLTKR